MLEMQMLSLIHRILKLIVFNRTLAKFGAIATVLAVAFDPFNQNLVHVVSGTVEDVGQMSTVSNGSQFQATGPVRGGDGKLH